LDNEQSWQKYENPISLTSDGEYIILYKSTDRAGNIEEEKAQKLKIDMTAPAINILLPMETQEFTRDEFFTPEYEIADSYSGVAADSLALLIDGRLVNQAEQDLFYYSLGEHVFKIVISDLAGNEAKASVKFLIEADLESIIADINRSYNLDWIKNEKIKKELIKGLNKIKKYEEKYGKRQDKKDIKSEKIMKQCLKKKNQAWCDKKLGKHYSKEAYKLNKINKKEIIKRYQEILKKLENYYKKQWLNQSAYDIIKADINYLINNL